MKQSKKAQHRWLLVVVATIIPLTLILGSQFDISQRITTPIVIIAVLVFGAMAMWMRANSTARGDEWWQDNNNSG